MNQHVRIMLIVVLVVLLVAAALRTTPALSGAVPARPQTSLELQADGARKPGSEQGTAWTAEDLHLPLGAGKEPGTGYAVQPGTGTGGAYHLTTGSASERPQGAEDGSWSVQGTAGSGEYRLDAATSILGTGTPCCCTYLPCSFTRYR
jgi:hypothetical protein